MSWLNGIPGQVFKDALSLAPHASSAHDDMAAAVAAGVDPRRYAIVSLAIAGMLCCETFIEALSGPLDGETARKVCTNWREAELDEQELIILAFTEKGTLDESSMRQDDVQDLRNAGLSDRDILSLTALISYQNYALRVAAALNVEPS